MMLGEEVSVNVDAIEMFASSAEKSFDELLQEAIAARKQEREQYARLLFRLGKRRAELNAELEKVQMQFRSLEALMERIDQAVCLLSGEQKEPPQKQQSKPRYLGLRHRLDVVGERLKEKFLGVNRPLTVRELADGIGAKTYTITNYLVGMNLKTQVLKEANVLRTKTSAKFYTVTQ